MTIESPHAFRSWHSRARSGRGDTLHSLGAREPTAALSGGVVLQPSPSEARIELNDISTRLSITEIDCTKRCVDPGQVGVREFLLIATGVRARVRGSGAVMRLVGGVLKGRRGRLGHPGGVAHLSPLRSLRRSVVHGLPACRP